MTEALTLKRGSAAQFAVDSLTWGRANEAEGWKTFAGPVSSGANKTLQRGEADAGGMQTTKVVNRRGGDHFIACPAGLFRRSFKKRLTPAPSAEKPRVEMKGYKRRGWIGYLAEQPYDPWVSRARVSRPKLASEIWQVNSPGFVVAIQRANGRFHIARRAQPDNEIGCLAVVGDGHIQMIHAALISAMTTRSRAPVASPFAVQEYPDRAHRICARARRAHRAVIGVERILKKRP